MNCNKGKQTPKKKSEELYRKQVVFYKAVYCQVVKHFQFHIGIWTSFDSFNQDKIKDGSLKYATKHIRDFIHIDDVIQAIDRIMLKITEPGLIDAPFRPAYDIGTGTGNVVHELARIRIPGIDIRLGDDCEAQDNTADITHIKELGFNPTIDVKDYLHPQ